MSDHSSRGASWHDAAALASFAIYEPSNSSTRWAGGFGADGTHLEVIALVDGEEVSVDSSSPERLTNDVIRRRVAVADMFWRHTLERDTDLDLPYSVTFVADDRLVTVGDDVAMAHGMRIDGDARWVGMLRVGEVMVKITTTSTMAHELRVCTDAPTLSEFPPNGH